MKKFISYIALIPVCLTIFPVGAFALTAGQIRQQMEDTNDQIEQIDREIKSLSNQITLTSQEKNTLANTLKELNLTRSKLLKEKEIIQKKINTAGLVIKNISSDITNKESSINISRKSLANMIRSLYENDNELLIERILSEESFTDFSRNYNDVLSLNEKIRENILEISDKKEELLVSKTEKEKEQSNLNTLKNNLTQKEKVVAVTQKEKDSLLAATKNKEAEYQKMLAEQLKKKETFEKELQEYEAKLKFILNPKLLPKEGSGVLSWPLSSILVTSLYSDNRCLLQLYGKCKPHYGIDFRAPVGTAVFAMEDGVVEGTGNTDIDFPKVSFGKWVFIKYDNGLSSTYGHLSLISVKKGQEIKKGDIVAYSGNTGASTGPHLHVSVYASTGVKIEDKNFSGKILTQPISALTAYINPAVYLPKITSDMIKK